MSWPGPPAMIDLFKEIESVSSRAHHYWTLSKHRIQHSGKACVQIIEEIAPPWYDALSSKTAPTRHAISQKHQCRDARPPLTQHDGSSSAAPHQLLEDSTCMMQHWHHSHVCTSLSLFISLRLINQPHPVGAWFQVLRRLT
jgi:hypothetical protein